jgi:excisionase family DNA binding protein
MIMALRKEQMTVQEACEVLGVTGGYIRRLLIRGDLAGSKFGTQWSISSGDVEKLRCSVGRRSKKAQEKAVAPAKPRRR